MNGLWICQKDMMAILHLLMVLIAFIGFTIIAYCMDLNSLYHKIAFLYHYMVWISAFWCGLAACLLNPHFFFHSSHIQPSVQMNVKLQNSQYSCEAQLN